MHEIAMGLSELAVRVDLLTDAILLGSLLVSFALFLNGLAHLEKG